MSAETEHSNTSKAMSAEETHYATLEVIESASFEAIKGAYKYLVQKWHPDKNQGNLAVAAEKTFRLNQAYKVLSDPSLREKYDTTIGPKQKETIKPDPYQGNNANRTPNAAFLKALTPSAELAAVVGEGPLPRSEVVSRLWSYIKKNNLQDPFNRRTINPDAALLKIFGKPQVSMFEIAGHIEKHLK